MKQTYPIYILEQPLRIIFPEDKRDIGHVKFWEKVVSKIVAKETGISLYDLNNIPYSCKRARVVGDIVYYGEEQSDDLLSAIKESTGNSNLKFAYDDHEKTLKFDIKEFEFLKFQTQVN